MEKEYLEVILENIDSKFDLVLEGYSTLNQKIDTFAQQTDERFDLVDLKFKAVQERINNVEKSLSEKIDAVAADLKAHRADTEAHHGVYRVKEGESL